MQIKIEFGGAASNQLIFTPWPDSRTALLTVALLYGTARVSKRPNHVVTYRRCMKSTVLAACLILASFTVPGTVVNGSAVLTVGNAAFGQLSGSQTVGRQVQLGLKPI